VPHNGHDALVGHELAGDRRGSGSDAIVVSFNQPERAAPHSAARIDLGEREIDPLFVHSAERFFPRAGNPDVHGC
jgi:hypothetical protein